MSIINVSNNEFDLSEIVITHKKMKELREGKKFLNDAIDNLRLEITDLQSQITIIQALIDEAKAAGVGE